MLYLDHGSSFHRGHSSSLSSPTHHYSASQVVKYEGPDLNHSAAAAYGLMGASAAAAAAAARYSHYSSTTAFGDAYPIHPYHHSASSGGSSVSYCSLYDLRAYC